MPSYVYLIIFALIVLAYLLTKGVKGKISSSRFILEQYSSDLTQLARENKLDPVINRQKEIQKVTQILLRRVKNNPLLLGKSGIGKTAIVEGLAQRIISGDVPKQLLGKRVLSLDLGGLVAGTKYRGEFEKRLQAMRDEIISLKRQVILFIDEVHSLAEAGEATGAIDAADILKPALARGDLQVIGATTLGEYKKYMEDDKTLVRRFQPVVINEPTPSQTLEILKGLRETYEDYHEVKITDQALIASIDYSKKITNRNYPDKAIDVLDEACSKVRLANIKSEGKIKAIVKPGDIQEILKQWVTI